MTFTLSRSNAPDPKVILTGKPAIGGLLFFDVVGSYGDLSTRVCLTNFRNAVIQGVDAVWRTWVKPAVTLFTTMASDCPFVPWPLVISRENIVGAGSPFRLA